MCNKSIEFNLMAETMNRISKAKTKSAIKETLMEIELLQDNDDLSQDFKAWINNLRLKLMFKLNNLDDYLS